MKKLNSKIANPVFLTSLLLLILNDWVFKDYFHNAVTGKLSDFAGLFAFPFLFSLLFPRFTRHIHIFTVLLFIWWKSEFSQAFIDSANYWGIPLYRTVDYTDLIALVSVLLSYHLLKKEVQISLKPILTKALVFVSCLAFMATTALPRHPKKYVGIDKEYHFDFSRRELISRLNMVQLKEIRRLNKYNGLIDFNEESNVFHYKGETDTLALILDPRKLGTQDTISFKTSFAEIQIMGNEEESVLRLVNVYKFVRSTSDKDFREKAIKQFEKRLVRKIGRYR
ncbi:hypothetical protein GWK08_16325 [Leptobacterium flavescens]|uniref:Uncharacterized protein n=1 Tax=Leptobacterium flavescens TaxID=472055 RepID=A0A6P0UW70_9FLAO|nr:hypothetical protein [Leptobacterium flavescens]NER15023.1 hypothetical protein [Leptobacterium flavescens]